MYESLDEIYNFALGPVLASFSTTKQLEMMKTLKPPFLDDYNHGEGDGRECIGISGKNLNYGNFRFVANRNALCHLIKQLGKV